MPRRKSKGGKTGKLDWSKHEQAWANLLHKEIFETGRYFRKTDVNVFKKKSHKSLERKKLRGASEEDEGFEEGTSNKPYVKMVQISSRDYLDQLHELISQLEDRVNQVSDEVNNMEDVEKKVDELTEEVNRIRQTVDTLRPSQWNIHQTDQKIQELRYELESCRKQGQQLGEVINRQVEDCDRPDSNNVEEKLSHVKLMTEEALCELELSEEECNSIKKSHPYLQNEKASVLSKISSLTSRTKDHTVNPNNEENIEDKIMSEDEINKLCEKFDQIINN